MKRILIVLLTIIGLFTTDIFSQSLIGIGEQNFSPGKFTAFVS